MNLEQELLVRSQQQCELCKAGNELTLYTVAPHEIASADSSIIVCNTCLAQLQQKEPYNPNHWRCLNDAMWSATPAVQVVAWRVLNSLKAEGWPEDLLDMLYLEESILAWAKEGTDVEQAQEITIEHRDCHGAILQVGDAVTLIKDLNVKGAGFTAKRGTTVRNISLSPDNEEHIEGRVNGQRIVILTKFVKKTTASD
jgi:protein PhnA